MPSQGDQLRDRGPIGQWGQPEHAGHVMPLAIRKPTRPQQSSEEDLTTIFTCLHVKIVFRGNFNCFKNLQKTRLSCFNVKTNCFIFKNLISLVRLKLISSLG